MGNIGKTFEGRMIHFIQNTGSTLEAVMPSELTGFKNDQNIFLSGN